MSVMKTIYLDEYGVITSEDKGIYTCILSGSYRYSQERNGYYHTVSSCIGFSIKEYFSKELLVDK